MHANGDAVLVSCVHVWRSSWRRPNAEASRKVRMVARTVEGRAGVCGLLLVVCWQSNLPSKPRSVRGLLEKPCPMQLVSLDYVGPLQWHGSSRSYLVVIDHSTRFVVGVACSRMDAESTVQLFRERLVSVFQTPHASNWWCFLPVLHSSYCSRRGVWNTLTNRSRNNCTVDSASIRLQATPTTNRVLWSMTTRYDRLLPCH